MDIHNRMTNKFRTAIEDFNLIKGIDNFVLLFSGGKDCTFLLDMLSNCFPSIMSKLDILCVMYPHHMYYDTNGKELPIFSHVKKIWETKGVKINYKNASYDDLPNDDPSGCKRCKEARKEVIDSYISTKADDTGIFTGYTLYDTLAYINMLLFYTKFNLENFESLPYDSKLLLTKTLHKVVSRERLPSGKIMIRPLLRFSEPEIEEYLSNEKIPYVTKAPYNRYVDTVCKIAKYKFKRQYFSALDVFHQDALPSYDQVIDMLHRHKLNTPSFKGMDEDNFFIDC